MIDSGDIMSALSYFCYDSDFKPFRQKVFGKECLVSTEGHILLVIKNFIDEDFFDYAHSDFPKDVENVIGDVSTTDTLSIHALERALDKIPKEKKYIEECKNCKGTGVVVWKHTDMDGKTHETETFCPVCDGMGWIRTDGTSIPLDVSSYVLQPFVPGYLVSVCGKCFHPELMNRVLFALKALGSPKTQFGFDKRDGYDSLIITNEDFTIVVAGVVNGVEESFKIIEC